MWARLGFVMLRLLLRFGIRLAPFLAIAGAGLLRKYRWRVYYGAARFKPRWGMGAAWRSLFWLLLALLALIILLFFTVTHLLPGGR